MGTFKATVLIETLPGSFELDEILSLSDRIAVMFDGRLMGFRDPEKTDERELGMMMAGMAGQGEAA